MADSFSGQPNENDETVLGRVHHNYHVIVQDLLAPDSEQRLRNLEIDRIPNFRRLFGNAAYPCRYLNCSRRSEGFSSAEKRKRHEALHLPGVFCQEQGCPFLDIEFANGRQLQNHIRSHHRKEPAALPRFKLAASVSATSISDAADIVQETTKHHTAEDVRPLKARSNSTAATDHEHLQTDQQANHGDISRISPNAGNLFLTDPLDKFEYDERGCVNIDRWPETHDIHVGCSSYTRGVQANECAAKTAFLAH